MHSDDNAVCGFIMNLVEARSRDRNVLFLKGEVSDRVAFAALHVIAHGEEPDGYEPTCYDDATFAAGLTKLQQWCRMDRSYKLRQLVNRYYPHVVETATSFHAFARFWDGCGRPDVDVENLPRDMFLCPKTYLAARFHDFPASMPWVRQTQYLTVGRHHDGNDDGDEPDDMWVPTAEEYYSWFQVAARKPGALFRVVKWTDEMIGISIAIAVAGEAVYDAEQYIPVLDTLFSSADVRDPVFISTLQGVVDRYESSFHFYDVAAILMPYLQYVFHMY